MARYFFRLQGWNINPEVPHAVYERCVIIAAPHTSNWDFFHTIATFDKLKIPIRFAAKKELSQPILGPLMESLGAIWIDRSAKGKDQGRLSYVEQMAQLFEGREQLTLVIAAEGTRSLTTHWKTGFYHVARMAQVPIALGYLDYENRIAGIGTTIMPTDDMEADMKKIMDFYREATPRYPEKFALDARFVS